MRILIATFLFFAPILNTTHAEPVVPSDITVEIVPLDDPSQDLPFKGFTRIRSMKKSPIEEPTEGQVRRIIIRAEKKYKLPPKLLDAVIGIESRWRSNAVRYESWIDRNQERDRHRSTSWGFMQVMGFHAGSSICPFVLNPKDLLRADANIMCGAAILNEALERHKNDGQLRIGRALQEYNAGPDAVGYGQGVDYKLKVLREFKRLGGKLDP